jgi:hypothetical protein
MNDKQHPNKDRLEWAIEALKQNRIPDGPPAELVASTIDAVTSSVSSTNQTQMRRKWLMRIAGLSGMAAAIALVVLFVGSFFLVDRSATYGFADVIENVKKAKSVILMSKTKIGNQPEFEFTWYIQDDHLRMEVPGAFAMIADLKAKKGIQLDLTRKTVKSIPVHADVAQGFMNPLQKLRQLSSKDAKKVGQEKMEGKTVDVYRLNAIDLFGMKAKGEGEMTLWADPKTQLPVKILIEVNTEMGRKGKPYDSRFTFENFSWHASIEPSLFTLEAPKGFTEIK